MPAATRTYWLTTPCRIRRKDQSLVIERADGTPVHIPITDVADIVACEPVDVNTAVISLLNTHNIDLHLLGHYGDYIGSLLTAESSTSGQTVLAQAMLATDATAGLEIARQIVRATAFNVRRVVDRELLTHPLQVLEASVRQADTREQLMGAEGTFRRSAWEVIDTHLPDWLQLRGRSRRPPRNAGNTFISYVNSIVYTRALTAIRLTPLHSGIAFLHSSIQRQRHSLALDLAEVFKPLFAERLLLRLAHRGQLTPQHFDQGVDHATLSDVGRKFVVQNVRDELGTTIQHRSLKRKVAYEELLYLEALKLTRTSLEQTPYTPFRIWW
ncbi:type I-B CRISPR-associated endonuclease Cas1b [Nocardia lijiangensis]|uniref:type I-B CRISPR-associated endonuclease Cas1b n=1 Tax=Nocardia lijiangensis TaxID=299618 RepID=UPI0008302C3C|nr:type I-B CRISPR-associated endonuclease Cas1b [Nocardia lijiangensis]